MLERIRNAVVWVLRTPLLIVGDAIDEALELLEGEEDELDAPVELIVLPEPAIVQRLEHVHVDGICYKRRHGQRCAA